MSEIPFTAPTLEQLSELLPQYDFQAFIAQGGMGAVYLALQRGLDREVAIKVLPKELGADPEFRASFSAEAKAMAKLNHPNLIGVYDFGDAGGMPYIVMEFVRGESLYHSSHDIKVAPAQAVDIVKKICDGLAHAHAQGIIHRDIKPANVLLNTEAQPKIGDFGLARPDGNDESGVVMGTPGYVAPEVLHHPNQADKRSDLFAVGVILYELITGLRAPLEKTPPASLLCGCDVSLDRICERAMNPVASLRYQTADEFSQDLAAWLAKYTQSGATAAIPRRQGPPAPRRPASRYRAASSRSSGGKGFFWLIVLGAAGFGAWHFFVRESLPQVPPAIQSTDTRKHDSGKTGGMLADGTSAPVARRAVNDKITPFGTSSPSSRETVSPFGSTSPGLLSGSARGNSVPETNGTVGSLVGPAPAEVSAMEDKAKKLLSDLESEWRGKLARNAKDYIADLDFWLRTLSKKEKETWGNEIAELKNRSAGDRVPYSAGSVTMSEKMITLSQAAAEKQKQIDEDFLAEVERIRTFYVKNLEGLDQKYSAANDTPAAKHVRVRVSSASTAEAWLSGLGFTPPVTNEVVSFE